MNITRIRQMAAQGDMSVDALRFLLDCHGECEHLDFKEQFDLDNDYGLSSFAKDVLGMKNVGGGYLVIGVRDKTWEYLGLKSRLPYDTKGLRDKVRKSTGLDLELDILQHEVFVEGTPKLFGLILVRSSTKRSKLKQADMPSTDFKPGERWGIRRGEIFVRSGDSTKRIESGSELNDLLDDLESRHQEQELEQANAQPSPFAVEQGLYRLLPREYETFVGRERYKAALRQAIEGDPRIWIVNLAPRPASDGDWLLRCCATSGRWIGRSLT